MITDYTQPPSTDFEISFKKLEYDSVQTLYRFVKVCKYCYPIYITLQRELLDKAKKADNQHLHQDVIQKFSSKTLQSLIARNNPTPNSNFSILQKPATAKLLPERSVTSLNTRHRGIDTTSRADSSLRAFRVKKLNSSNSKLMMNSFSNQDSMPRSIQTTKRKDYQERMAQRLQLGFSIEHNRYPTPLLDEPLQYPKTASAVNQKPISKVLSLISSYKNINIKELSAAAAKVPEEQAAKSNLDRSKIDQKFQIKVRIFIYEQVITNKAEKN